MRNLLSTRSLLPLLFLAGPALGQFSDCTTAVVNVADEFCVVGVCDYDTCDAGWDDCDGERFDGCEEDIWVNFGSRVAICAVTSLAGAVSSLRRASWSWSLVSAEDTPERDLPRTRRSLLMGCTGSGEATTTSEAEAAASEYSAMARFFSLAAILKKSTTFCCVKNLLFCVYIGEKSELRL